MIWGTSFILIKKSLLAFSPVEVGSLRILAAGCVLLPLSIPRFKGINFRQLKWLFVSGAIGSMIPAVLFALAQTQLDSSVSGALNALTPIFVLLMGALLFGQKIRKESLLGIVIGFAGTIILVISGSGGELGELNLGVFLIIAATFCYGLNVNIIKYKLPGISSLSIAAISLVCMVPMAGGLLWGFTDIAQISSRGVEWEYSLAAVVGLGIVATGFALILFNRLVQLTNPVFTSTVTYIIPIVALFWGTLDGEKLQQIQLMGMAAVIIGVYIANRKVPAGAK
jgi:drug/metabolite transporter (DMT)-like permease